MSVCILLQLFSEGSPLLVHFSVSHTLMHLLPHPFLHTPAPRPIECSCANLRDGRSQCLTHMCAHDFGWFGWLGWWPKQPEAGSTIAAPSTQLCQRCLWNTLSFTLYDLPKHLVFSTRTAALEKFSINAGDSSA